MAVRGENFNIKLVAASLGYCVHEFGQRGKVDDHRLRFCGSKAAIKVPEINTIRQYPAPLTTNIFTHFMLDRLENAVAVFAFNSKSKCFFHAAIMRKLISSLRKSGNHGNLLPNGHWWFFVRPVRSPGDRWP